MAAPDVIGAYFNTDTIAKECQAWGKASPDTNRALRSILSCFERTLTTSPDDDGRSLLLSQVVAHAKKTRDVLKDPNASVDMPILADAGDMYVAFLVALCLCLPSNVPDTRWDLVIQMLERRIDALINLSLELTRIRPRSKAFYGMILVLGVLNLSNPLNGDMRIVLHLAPIVFFKNALTDDHLKAHIRSAFVGANFTPLNLVVRRVFRRSYFTDDKKLKINNKPDFMTFYSLFNMLLIKRWSGAVGYVQIDAGSALMHVCEQYFPYAFPEDVMDTARRRMYMVAWMLCSKFTQIFSGHRLGLSFAETETRTLHRVPDLPVSLYRANANTRKVVHVGVLFACRLGELAQASDLAIAENFDNVDVLSACLSPKAKLLPSSAVHFLDGNRLAKEASRKFLHVIVASHIWREWIPLHAERRDAWPLSTMPFLDMLRRRLTVCLSNGGGAHEARPEDRTHVWAIGSKSYCHTVMCRGWGVAVRLYVCVCLIPYYILHEWNRLEPENHIFDTYRAWVEAGQPERFFRLKMYRKTAAFLYTAVNNLLDTFENVKLKEWNEAPDRAKAVLGWGVPRPTEKSSTFAVLPIGTRADHEAFNAEHPNVFDTAIRLPGQF